MLCAAADFVGGVCAAADRLAPFGTRPLSRVVKALADATSAKKSSLCLDLIQNQLPDRDESQLVDEVTD